MSNYQDLCDMYGRDASDPDFIDDLIDGVPHGRDYYHEEDINWFRENKETNHYKLLMEQLKNVHTLLYINVPIEAEFSLLVMLHAHIVSAVEGYLSGVFIHKVCNSEELTQKLIETNPELSKRKFTLGELYQTKDALEATVASYLKDLIFHDLQKIKPMYKSVLNHDFSELFWLFKAILVRHHCVHRAGYDKDKNKVNVTTTSINDLLSSAVSLADELNDL
jgi:hypothetical protein